MGLRGLAGVAEGRHLVDERLGEGEGEGGGEGEDEGEAAFSSPRACGSRERNCGSSPAKSTECAQPAWSP